MNENMQSDYTTCNKKIIYILLVFYFISTYFLTHKSVGYIH